MYSKLQRKKSVFLWSFKCIFMTSECKVYKHFTTFASWSSLFIKAKRKSFSLKYSWRLWHRCELGPPGNRGRAGMNHLHVGKDIYKEVEPATGHQRATPVCVCVFVPEYSHDVVPSLRVIYTAAHLMQPASILTWTAGEERRLMGNKSAHNKQFNTGWENQCSNKLNTGFIRMYRHNRKTNPFCVNSTC